MPGCSPLEHKCSFRAVGAVVQKSNYNDIISGLLAAQGKGQMSESLDDSGWGKLG